MQGQRIITGLGELFLNQEHGKTLDEYETEHVSNAGKKQFQQLEKLGLGISLGIA